MDKPQEGLGMLEKPIEELTEGDLLQLVDRIGEGHRLEFKLRVPDDQDLRADVVALANSSGGDLLIGVEEGQAIATAISGVDADPDDILLQIESILRARISPRLPSLKTAAIPLASGRHVIVVRVDRSWAAPHGVQSGSGQSWRFVGRGSRGLYDLDYEQVRAAFLGAADLPVRLRELHRDEVNKALAGDIFGNIDTSLPTVVLTFTPLTTAAGTPQAIRLGRSVEGGPHPPHALGQSAGWGERWNIDGIGLVARGYKDGDPDLGLVQLYRDGRVTFVDTNSIKVREGEKVVASVAWPNAVRLAVRDTLEWMRESDVAPPVVVQIALLGVTGCSLATRFSSFSDGPPRLDRDVVELPAVQLDDLAVPDDGAAGLGLIFDTLWQAFGQRDAPRGKDLFGSP